VWIASYRFDISVEYIETIYRGDTSVNHILRIEGAQTPVATSAVATLW
jgi:hypothetical protein